MIFNGIEKDYLIPSTGRRRPAWAPVTRQFVSAPGMTGAHLSYTETQIREITVPITIEAKNIKDLQKVKEDLAEWLIHDEPKELVFKDEPDRIYYAIVDGSLDLDEIVRYGRGEITFICPDPYKYGPEKTREFQDSGIVENKGTAEADPIFELEVLQLTTFAMVSNGEEYNMIGRPVDVDDVAYSRLETILNDNCSSLVGWSHLPGGTQLDTGIVGGEMIVQGGYAFTAGSYGTNPNGWVGPAIRKSLSEPVQDFRAEIRIGAFNTSGDVGSLELHLLDENDNVIAILAMRDSTARTAENRAVIQLGEAGSRRKIVDYNGGYRATWNDFSGIIRLEREGSEFRAYVAMLDGDRHIRRYTAPVYYDTLGQYQGKVAQVLVYDAKAKDYSTYTKLMNNIYIGKINQDVGIPYIADAGDIITFDHQENVILINGEPRKDLKDFGGNYFKLAKGENTLVVMPENSFNTKLRFRERYR